MGKNLIVLQPCPIGGKCVAEANFNKKLSIEALYAISQKEEKIRDFRGSIEFSIAKFYLGEKRIRLDGNGNVHISNISDEQEAKIWINRVESIVQKAFI